MTLEKIWFCWDCQFICPRIGFGAPSLTYAHPSPEDNNACNSRLLAAQFVDSKTIEVLEEPEPHEFARKGV